MLVQAFSAIAKDLNKMSAKSSAKLMVPEHAEGNLYLITKRYEENESKS